MPDYGHTLRLGSLISPINGVGVFNLLGADDPALIHRFAERVAPEVRVRVAEARGTSR